MERLGLDYLDLYLIHWPIPKNEQENYIENNRETWKAFEELYHEGKIKAIGVSNFKPHHLEEIMEGATVMPMVNQIEFHPGWTQMETVNYCKAHHIAVQAWSPFGSGELFRMPEISEMAKKYGKDPGQLALRWIFQHGVIPLPKSVNPERILSNTQIFDFEITPEDMAYIDSLQAADGAPIRTSRNFKSGSSRTGRKPVRLNCTFTVSLPRVFTSRCGSLCCSGPLNFSEALSYSLLLPANR